MIVSFSVVPAGTGTELKEQIAEVLKVVDQSGLTYRLTAMSTEIEGDWDEVMGVIKDAHEAARRFSGRVVTSITVDDHKGRTGRLTGKVEDVEGVVGKKLERGS
jgi:uncharacterized protein (TIGR00106 family)